MFVCISHRAHCEQTCRQLTLALGLARAASSSSTTSNVSTMGLDLKRDVRVSVSSKPNYYRECGFRGAHGRKPQEIAGGFQVSRAFIRCWRASPQRFVRDSASHKFRAVPSVYRVHLERTYRKGFLLRTSRSVNLPSFWHFHVLSLLNFFRC